MSGQGGLYYKKRSNTMTMRLTIMTILRDNLSPLVLSGLSPYT